MKYGTFHHVWADAGDYVSTRARKRYEFALSHLQPRCRVLDVGCGSGEGSQLLQELGCDVLPLDVDGASGARLVADTVALPLRDDSFDAVTAFEVVEHMSREDGAVMLSEFHRVLKPQGVAFLSTPNVNHALHPQYHIHEFQPEEFFAAVESVFPVVSRFAQYATALDVAMIMIRRHLSPAVYGLSKAGIVQRVEGIAPSSPDYYDVRPFDRTRSLQTMVAVARMHK